MGGFFVKVVRLHRFSRMTTNFDLPPAPAGLGASIRSAIAGAAPSLTPSSATSATALQHALPNFGISAEAALRGVGQAIAPSPAMPTLAMWAGAPELAHRIVAEASVTHGAFVEAAKAIHAALLPSLALVEFPQPRDTPAGSMLQGAWVKEADLYRAHVLLWPGFLALEIESKVCASTATLRLTSEAQGEAGDGGRVVFRLVGESRRAARLATRAPTGAEITALVIQQVAAAAGALTKALDRGALNGVAVTPLTRLETAAEARAYRARPASPWPRVAVLAPHARAICDDGLLDAFEVVVCANRSVFAALTGFSGGVALAAPSLPFQRHPDLDPVDSRGLGDEACRGIVPQVCKDFLLAHCTADPATLSSHGLKHLGLVSSVGLVTSGRSPITSGDQEAIVSDLRRQLEGQKADAAAERKRLDQVVAAATADRDAARGRLDAAVAHRADALAEADALRAELATAREHIKALLGMGAGVDVGELPAQPETSRLCSNIGEWASALRPRVVVHPKAIRLAEKSVYPDEGEVARALDLLAGPYWQMKFAPAPGSRERCLAALASEGLEASPTGTASTDHRFASQYEVMHDNRRLTMDMHLKGPRRRGTSQVLRIYFTFLEDRKQILVGSLPEHLDNRLT